MVNAYLHLENPRVLQEIIDLFPEEYELHIAQVFPNSFLLGSHFISPSQLKRHCGSALAGSRYVIMILKNDKSVDFLTGDGDRPAFAVSSDFQFHP